MPDYKYFSILLFCLVSLSAVAQNHDIFNGDFEFRDKEGHPNGWTWGFTKDQDQRYSIAVDSLIKVKSKYSISIERIRKDGQYGVASYVIPKTFKGKTIMLKGYLKTEKVEGFAGMWLRVDGINGTIAFDNMENQGVTGSTDFKEYTIQLPYDDEKALKIYTGALLAGSGKLWVDHIRLYIDGVSIDSAQTKLIQLSKAETDTSFSRSSGIQVMPMNEQRLINLNKLGKVWGFLKYYHPEVAAGNLNMDAELFRVLPDILQSANNSELSNALERWVDKIGDSKLCGTCTPPKENDVLFEPDHNGILDSHVFSPSLVSKLKYILDHSNNEKHFYVNIADEGTGSPVFTNEKGYTSMSYPDAGYRLLCLFRYWNMVEYFYPDKHLIGNWDQVLSEYIPQFFDAQNETAYALITLSLIANLHDTHANIWYNPAIENFKGKYGLPIQVRFIEGKLVVTGYYTDSAKVNHSLIIGDIITKINGQSVDDLVKKYLPISPASNYMAQLRDMPHNFLMRSNKQEFELDVKREVKDLHLILNAIDNSKINYTLDINPAPQDPAYKIIKGNIGYIFPGRYKNTDLPAIEKLFAGTKGIIVDMRCYPSDFMPFTFVPFIKSGNKAFVKFTSGSITKPGAFRISAVLNSKGNNAYKGKVIVIVNEQTQSQAEYTTMAFQSSPNVKVIGSTTSGADGNICNITLPGGINTYMSGIGVLYPDGTESQRCGVRIDYVVKPTINGIKTFHDELLERAVKLINAK